MGNLVWSGGWLGFPDILTQTRTTTLGNSNHGPMSPIVADGPLALHLKKNKVNNWSNTLLNRINLGSPCAGVSGSSLLKWKKDFKLWAETQFEGQETDSQCHRQYISFKLFHYSIYSLARKNIWVNKEKIILLELQKPLGGLRSVWRQLAPEGTKVWYYCCKCCPRQQPSHHHHALSTFLFL